MFTNIKVLNKTFKLTSLLFQARFKSNKEWVKLKLKNTMKFKAQTHFDDFYGSVFGKNWESMRVALLRRSKYVAVVNNYGDTEETQELLLNRGAHCLRNLVTIQQNFHNEYSPPTVKPQVDQNLADNSRVQEYGEKVILNEMTATYPQIDHAERLELNNNEENVENKLTETKPKVNKTLEESLADAEIDQTRIIDPAMGISAEVLYQYIPATKLKGMDDWVPESLHYSYNSKSKDFPLIIEPETKFNFPEHLKVYTYEMDSELNTFPEPRRGQTGVFNYYCMDCGSVLAVLALCLSPGDRVLDLCAGPGGKSLVALQTLLPDVVVCNDVSISRCNRITRIFSDFFFDFATSNKWRERVVFTHFDGRMFTDDGGFDKVIVDVPCTTDRHSMNTDGNNIFRPDRVKERLRLPEVQSQLLANALKLVKVGGAVVYSTCSLSPVQNDGVVHAALRQAFEQHSIVATVRDLTSAMAGFSSTLVLGTGNSAPKYGQLVVPSVSANFGPSYISRLVRVK